MATAAKARFASEEIKPNIGSRVLADKEALLSGNYADDIMDLLEQRGVLMFPEILHRATAYPLDCGRMLHRTKLEGDEPIA